jgi:hypothetical protein
LTHSRWQSHPVSIVRHRGFPDFLGRYTSN